MVSLLKLAKVTEQGVQFESPHDDSTMVLRLGEAREEFKKTLARLRTAQQQTPIDLNQLEKAIDAVPDPADQRARMKQAAEQGHQTSEQEAIYIYPLLLARLATRDETD